MAFIIAEAGVNHNGSLELAKELIDVAVLAKADAVKFQTFIPEEVISHFAPKAEYQKQTTGADESQLDMVRKLVLSKEEHIEIYKYCAQKGIMFLSTPFDLPSIEFLNELGLEFFKIPSGEITNKPYLQRIAKLKKRIILSTGMAQLDEIQAVLDILTNAGTPLERITVLHCNTAYPTPIEDANLKAMLTIKDTFNVAVGYSDHTLGVEASVAAVALGAEVIEKHFTLDKNLDGPDHKASLTPIELIDMVRMIRNVEKALGSGLKIPSASEIINRDIARKSIVAAVDLKKGEILSEKNITTKRPGSGINPMRWDDVIGKKAIRDFVIDEMIEL